ncbi:hypothetical protein GGQ69_002516 [Micrococcus sp. TA1]|nr:hypothetical protein [Micrococcus sp. TA1]
MIEAYARTTGAERAGRTGEGNLAGDLALQAAWWEDAEEP